MFNRRNFLKFGGLALSGGVLLSADTRVFGQISSSSELFPIPAEVYASRNSSFTVKTFEPYVGTAFEVAGDDGAAPTSLVLVEVAGSDFKNGHRADVPVDGFLVIFETSAKSTLEDKIHEVSHPELGTFSVFLSRVGRSGKRYQAVFSRVYV